LSTYLIIDGVALLLLLIAGISGMIKGAVKILGSIAGFAGAIFLGWRYTPLLAQQLAPKLNSVAFGNILAFSLIFIAVMALTALIVFILTKLFEAILLGWLNKLLGFLVGLILGLLIVAVIVWVSLLIYPELMEMYKDTRLVKVIAALVSLWVPASL